MSKFKIMLDKSGRGKIFIDNKDISNSTQGFNLFTNVGETSLLEIKMVGGLEIEGDANIKLILPSGEEFKVKEI